ncbi:MAG: VOC family protein [Mucilaginibacter sp.]|uniref:bleomycin resistance protein n=1 Tax=Mucilaginibacter sp. TaxID=1882438 RepID=UPI0031A4B12B
MLQTAIPVLASLNEEETIQFYTQKMGFTFHASWDGYLILSRDGIYIHLWPCSEPAIAKSTSCYIVVTEIEKLFTEYKSNGINPDTQLQDRPWKMKEFSILDNNGNLIHFGQDISGS